LTQAKYLLSKVSEFENVISNKFTCKPSVIIAGDFNSTPGDKVWVAVLALRPQDFSTVVNSYCYQFYIDCRV
jgi:endonuclease/exonuclease/phosphatase family metal-dependent hydrolase